MKNLQAFTDKTAISLSLLCGIHCLALPLLLTLLPGFSALQLDGEALHLWLLLAVIPSSLYALTTGCKKHQHYKVTALCIPGLVILIVAAFLGEHILGELWEKTLTVIGASIVAASHIWNYRLCREADCACTETRE